VRVIAFDRWMLYGEHLDAFGSTGAGA